MSECLERNNDRCLPLLSFELTVSVKETLIEKKIEEKLDFVGNRFFIRGSTEAGFRGCSSVGSRENILEEPYFSKVIAGLKPVTLL